MDKVNKNTKLVDTFIVLQVAGTVGFSLIFLTALLSPRVIRHPTWFSFCLSWIAWGISFSLLFFSGQQAHVTSQPLCVAQSALVYAMPHLAGFTSVALLVHLFLNVRSALISQASSKPRWDRQISLFLVLLPWTIGVVVLIAFLLFAIKHPSDVQLSHNQTYCVLVNSFLPKITASTGTFTAIMILALEAVITRILYRNRNSIDGFPQSVYLTAQLILFTVVALCAVGLGLVFVITRTRSAVFDIMLGALPTATAIIFGTQRDIILCWMFWKSREAPTHHTQRAGSGMGELTSIRSLSTE